MFVDSGPAGMDDEGDRVMVYRPVGIWVPQQFSCPSKGTQPRFDDGVPGISSVAD